MTTDYDPELRRLLADLPDPETSPDFTSRVSSRITRARRARRVGQAGLIALGVAILALLTPGLIDLSGHLALGVTRLTELITTLLLSPAGWVLGGGLGLLILAKAR